MDYTGIEWLDARDGLIWAPDDRIDAVEAIWKLYKPSRGQARLILGRMVLYLAENGRYNVLRRNGAPSPSIPE